jgi:hypothetical protein
MKKFIIVLLMLSISIATFSQAEAVTDVTIWHWLVNAWPVISISLLGLVVLLPVKWQGIVKFIINIIGSIINAISNRKARKAARLAGKK